MLYHLITASIYLLTAFGLLVCGYVWLIVLHH
jgi:hypothetical protein